MNANLLGQGNRIAFFLPLLPLLLLGFPGCTPRYHGLSVVDPQPLPFFSEYRGKVVVLYFGYTHCPEVCPVMLQKLKGALKLLPERSKKRVQILMVSLDPERDTPEVLQRYLERFDPHFQGKLLAPQELKGIARALGVVALTGEEGYIEHLSYAVVLDGEGVPRVLFPVELSPEEMAADLKALLAPRFLPFL